MAYYHNADVIGKRVGKTFTVESLSGEKNKRGYHLYNCRCEQCDKISLLTVTEIRDNKKRCRYCFVPKKEAARREKDALRGVSFAETVYIKIYGNNKVPDSFERNLIRYMGILPRDTAEILRLLYENHLTLQQTSDMLNGTTRQNIAGIAKRGLNIIKDAYETEFPLIEKRTIW